MAPAEVPVAEAVAKIIAETIVQPVVNLNVKVYRSGKIYNHAVEVVPAFVIPVVKEHV